MAKITQTVPFSFDELYEEARKLFGNAGFDVSDGSNTSQLAAVMSYLISALNTNTAININETLLPYATKRKNILQDARVLGYEAKHKTSFQYRLKVRLDDKVCGYKSFTFKKFDSISANGNTYYYFGKDLKVNLGQLVHKEKEISPNDLEFVDSKVFYNGENVTEKWSQVQKEFEKNRNIELVFKEGELIKTEDDVSSLSKTIGSITINGSSYTRNYIDIPYTDVENDGIECIVSYYDEEGNYQENVLFQKTENYFFEKDGDEHLKHSYIRLDDIEMSTPRLYFRYAGMGEGIPYGSVVKLNILISHAEEGGMGELGYETINTSSGNVLSFKGISFNACPSDNNGISNVFDNCIVTSCDLVQTGFSEESNESIQENAPKVYNSAHRLITNLDFKAACNRSSYVHDSSVWGGEDEFPKAPGHVWFSFLPERTSERSFSSNEDNSEFQRKNSSLVYNYQEGESEYQYVLRQNYYHKNYILNTEIKNEKGGIWGDLMSKCMPSLTFHHRHPLYLNFNYDFNILKYNIKQNTKDVHKELFNVLDNCFYGSDSLKLERFDSEYFHSNIIKRIDYMISDLCGFTSFLNTQIVLNEKTLCVENWNRDYKDIYIPLCVPFEKYFDNEGYLETSRLPCIDTKNFIDYKFDEIIEPTSEYPHGEEIVNKSENLKYSIVSGDLFVDWSRFNNRKEPDISAKVFIAPVKIKMKYTYRCKNLSEKYIKLGFKLAPDNTMDESYNNIKVNILNANGEVVCSYGKDCEKSFVGNFFIDYENRERLCFSNEVKTLMTTGRLVEVEFTRTCGYYYLFNTFKKEILVHLFVNGSFEGFKIAKNGMLENDYYDHYLDKLNETWLKNESEYTDDDMYVDITYSTPRSYLYTSDRRGIEFLEPTGKELEKEKHLFNYGGLATQEDRHQIELPSSANEDVKDLFNQGYDADTILNILPNIASDYDDREEENSIGHCLTTEGYLVDGKDDLDTYTGPIVREYNENMYLFTPLTVDLFKQNVYMNVKYPSENFKVHRNVIPRLNNVKFKNAVELY